MSASLHCRHSIRRAGAQLDKVADRRLLRRRPLSLNLSSSAAGYNNDACLKYPRNYHCYPYCFRRERRLGLTSLQYTDLLSTRNFSSNSRSKRNTKRTKDHQSGKRRNRKKKKKRSGRSTEVVAPTFPPTCTGRPVLTEERVVREDILAKLRLGNGPTNSAKSVLYNAKDKLDFELNSEHSSTAHQHHNSPPLFIATVTATFPHGDDILAIMDQPHPHVVETQTSLPSRCLELTCAGAAPSKKKAEMLAAVDTLALLQEIGVADARNPPNFKAERIARARKEQRQLALQEAEEAKEAFKADLATAQMMLEMLHVARPKFVHQEATGRRGKDSGWTASASLFLRGQSVSIEGPPGQNKVEAKGRALIAMSRSDEVERIVGRDVMETYQKLIDDSPGGRIASLRIPPLPDDLLDDIQQSLAWDDRGGYKQRAESFMLVKEEHERGILERMRRGRNSSEHGRHRTLPENHLMAINQALEREEEQRLAEATGNPNGKEAAMKAVRDALPIKSIQHELTDALVSAQVIVVSGGTGSGKSTQCPQYILEDAIAKEKGATTKILVTQPRRIAAVSVAERVAAERGEAIGNSVGYTVRFKRNGPREHGGSVEFVTTGVLLRRLINDPSLSGISHVMIDEVHERDINTDFLMVLLRELLKERPDLRVVLMSATLDAESFSDYFSTGVLAEEKTQVPLLSVPTQPRYPVEVFYLEDLINQTTPADSYSEDMKRLASSLLQYNDKQLEVDLEEASDEEFAADELQARSRAEDEGETLANDYDSGSDLSNGVSNIAQPDVMTRIDSLRKAISLRKENDQSHTYLDLPDRFDPRATVVELATKVAKHLCQEEIDAGRSGSILCFLPGWDEIKAAMEDMAKTPRHLKSKITILPLHSTIPHDDQQRVFEPAAGKVKVILATNIAESSVTIDDVLAVVDCGLVRQLNYDAESAMSAMETTRTSRASATQRLGRAGRVSAGKCFRLYSRGDFEAMPPRPTPEIQRTALEATCLQTCSMTSRGVEQFLRQALDPPAPDSVSLAMDRLVKLGAISADGEEERLSPLGRCLSHLPLDPATGRMLIMGVVMKTLGPLLTTAACFSSRNTFYNPPGLREEARGIRKSFAASSDVLAMVAAYDEFWDIVEKDGWGEAKNWASDSFVSISAMVSIKAVRSQLLGELRRIGIVPPSDLEREGRSRKQKLRENASVNANAHNEKLYTAIWATAFPSNLAGRRQLGSFGTLRTSSSDHAGIHPSSVMFHRKPPSEGRVRFPNWYLYREMVLSSQVFLRDVTAMEPEQIVLFGGYTLNPIAHRSARTSRVRYLLDDWIVVEGPCSVTIDALSIARKEINLALEHKVMFPNAPLPGETQQILDSVCELLDPDQDCDGYA